VVIVAGCAYDDGVVALRGAIPMRTACALVLFALFAATPASAQKIDVSTIKCEEFVKSGKDTIGNLLMWLSGYYSGEDDEAIIDFDKMAADGEKLGKLCGENPSLGLLTAAERIMSK
jgi:acid stress chaperone HdeB